MRKAGWESSERLMLTETQPETIGQLMQHLLVYASKHIVIELLRASCFPQAAK